MIVAQECWEAPLLPLEIGRRELDYVCWTRMQAEAGQPLDAIVRRKELERRAGRGKFFWGVGNAPAVITGALAKLKAPVEVIFSIMKSRPKIMDRQSVRNFTWRRYVDHGGAIRELPRHVLVTSRAENPTGLKSKHFALMCQSDRPLAITHGEAFDPTAYRNAGGVGAPVGASQVTALLRRIHPGSAKAGYEVNLRAWLDDSYWVKLIDPIEICPDFEKLDSFAPGSVEEWLRFVEAAKAGRRFY